jgi:hypothetical protein
VFHNAPETYRTVTDANAWLTVEEAKILQGTWVPVAGTPITVFPCWCSRYSAVLLGVRKQHGGICRTSNTYHSGYGSLMPCGEQEKALHCSPSLEERSPGHASLFPPRVRSPGRYQGKSDTLDSRVYVTWHRSRTTRSSSVNRHSLRTQSSIWGTTPWPRNAEPADGEAHFDVLLLARSIRAPGPAVRRRARRAPHHGHNFTGS